jgi:hypothetical protein
VTYDILVDHVKAAPKTMLIVSVFFVLIEIQPGIKNPRLENPAGDYI